MRWLLGASPLLVLALGCAPRSSSSSVPLKTGVAPVADAALVLLRAPPTEPVALIEARGYTLQAATDDFRAEAARSGGGLAIVERYRAELSLVTHAETYTYACGKNSTCTGTRLVTTEVMTIILQGRAYPATP